MIGRCPDFSYLRHLCVSLGASYVRLVPLEPKNVQQIGNELAVLWSDGVESYLPLELTRRACPCASCGGEPDVLGNLARPKVTYGPNSFELTGWEFVGGYAIKPRWRDGHGTGLYSYTYLRRLADSYPSVS